MEVSDRIALAVGTYAGIVATATLLWTIARERRRIRLRLEYSGNKELITNIYVTIINATNDPATLQYVGFKCSRHVGDMFDPRTYDLPYPLPARSNCVWNVDAEWLTDKIGDARMVRFWVEDATHRRYWVKLPRREFRVLARTA